DPRAGGWLPARQPRAVRAAAADGSVVVLRVDLSQCSELAPGGAGHGVGCGLDHPAAVEHQCRAPAIASAAFGHAVLPRADGLAAWALRPDQPEAGRRGGAPRP